MLKLTDCLKRVLQSSIEIQEKLHEKKLIDNVELSVKIGVSYGQIQIINIGGI